MTAESTPSREGWFASRRKRVAALIRRALSESTSPGRFACAFAIGAFVSASPVPPVLFMRTGASIGLAWIFKLNRLTAFLGSQACFGPLWLVAASVEVKLGCTMLSRTLPPLPTIHDDLTAAALRLARESLAPWLAGSIIVAPAVGVIAGGLVYPFVRRWHLRRPPSVPPALSA